MILDRIFTNLPPFTFQHCKWELTIEQDPKNLYTSGISDHAPVVATTHFKALTPLDSPIPLEICRDRNFVRLHDQIVWEEKLLSYSGLDRLRFHKQIMAAAAQYTRQFLQDNVEETVFIKAQNLTTISRIVWTQNISLAEKLIGRSDTAKKQLQILDGKVLIVGPDLFPVEISDTETTSHQDNVNAVIANPAQMQKK